MFKDGTRTCPCSRTVLIPDKVWLTLHMSTDEADPSANMLLGQMDYVRGMINNPSRGRDDVEYVVQTLQDTATQLSLD